MRRLIPASFLMGAAFLLGVDDITRALMEASLPFKYRDCIRGCTVLRIPHQTLKGRLGLDAGC